jgi:hypothetical protein
LAGCTSLGKTSYKWQQYASATEGFTVDAPGPFATRSEKVANSDDRPVSFFQAEIPRHQFCVIAVRSAYLREGESTYEHLERVLRSVESTESRMTSMKRGTKRGIPYVDFEDVVRKAAVSVVGRAYLYNGKLYLLHSRLDSSHYNSEEDHRFLDSFELTPVPASSATPPAAPAPPSAVTPAT